MDADDHIRRAALLSDTPDTDELLLREIEKCVAQARTAFDAEKWNDAALYIGFASTQAMRLIEYLRPRLTEQGPNVGDLA